MTMWQAKDRKVIPMQLLRPNDGLYSYNSYLYFNGEDWSMIDGGLGQEEQWELLKGTLKAHNIMLEQIQRIFITHHHDDHIGIVSRLLREIDVPVYAHPAAVDRLTYEPQFFAKRLQFFDALYAAYGLTELAKERRAKMQETYEKACAGTSKYKITAPITPVQDGEVVAGLRIIYTPGHSPDSIIFYDDEVKWQFTGDLLLQYSSTNALIDFDASFKLLPTVAQYEHSLHKSLTYKSELLLPGHHNPFTVQQEVTEKRLLRIEQKCERLVKAVREGNQTIEEIARAMYGNRLYTQFSLVSSEVIGYADYVVQKGYVEKRQVDGIWYFEGI